jgi:secreted PhoX family phosphatase
MLALERLSARQAVAASAGGRAHAAIAGESYGPLAPVADQRGVEVLALPVGFSYVTVGRIGEPMSDGTLTPLALDGMAAFAGPLGGVRLIRNHEDRNPPGEGSVPGQPHRMYDPEAGGGTTTLDFDPASRTLVRDFVSLNGTTVNCAGGIGYRGRSWITCEETVAGPNHTSVAQRFTERHGYCYEVPVTRGPGGLRRARPIRAMGRFSHEALAVDQRTGIVYLTEDPGSGQGAGFYRFLPENPRRLLDGGKLQMLGVKRVPQGDMRKGQTVGDSLSVVWLDIEFPDPEYETNNDPQSVFNQGYAAGGAKFNRLEGCWYDEGSIFFVSTSGGDAENGDVNAADQYREGFGQVWEYRPSARHGGLLTLFFESPSGDVCDSPDNMTVTPRGGLVLCEDDASSAYVDSHPSAPGITHVNRLIGLTPDGDPFEFAVNRFNGSELAGVCFSPDGRWMFFNIFGISTGTPQDHAGEGMTCAVTGPWEAGPL